MVVHLARHNKLDNSKRGIHVNMIMNGKYHMQTVILHNNEVVD